MQDFKKLKVWQRAHELALAVYRLTEALPAHERYGLVSQLRRAAAAVPSNIAEGSKRRTAQDFGRLINIAEGSAGELEYLLILCRDLGHLGRDESATLLHHVSDLSRMLFALRVRIQHDAA